MRSTTEQHLVVLISGKQGSGKSTLARDLAPYATLYGYDTVHLISCGSDLIRRQVDDKLLSPKPLLITIDEVQLEAEFEAIPDSLRVRLECSEMIRKMRSVEAWRDPLAMEERGLDRYACLDVFDLYLDTGDENRHIIAQKTLRSALKFRNTGRAFKIIKHIRIIQGGK